MKDVVCALIVHRGKLLIAQHGPDSGHPWKWEFPGGKIQPGETVEAALAREVAEELEIEVMIDIGLLPVVYTYADKTIRLHPYLCCWKNGKIQLTEHHDYRWISPEETKDFDMLPADLEMLTTGGNLEKLMDYTREQPKDKSKQQSPD